MGTARGRQQSDTHRNGRTSTDGGRAELRVDPVGMETSASDRGVPILSTVFHAIRRRWPRAAGFGLLCSLICVSAVIALRPPMFTAASQIHIAETKPSLVFETETPRSKGDGREFRLAQQQLVKSRIVADRAIAASGEACTAAWLAKTLEVGFPSGTQVMEVELKGEDSQQVATLVDEVVQAYVNLVNEQERASWDQRLEDLERVYAEREREVRDKRRQLQGMRVRSGLAESVSSSSEWQIAMNRLSEVHRELLRYNSVLEDVRGEIEVRRADADREGPAPITPEELRSLAADDQELARLSAEQEQIASQLTQIRSIATPTALARLQSPYLARQEQLETQVNARMTELEKRACNAKCLAALDKIKSLQQQARLAERRVEQLKESAKQWKQQLEKLNPSTVNTESIVEAAMLDSEIRQLDRVLSTIAQDREKELVELAADDRVRVLQTAQVSGAGDRAARMFLAGATGFFAFLLPVACVILWDVRQRLIGSPSEIAANLRIGLLGTVPHASPARPFVLAPWRKRNGQQASLSDATDTITVRLLREAQIEDKRVIAICSAVYDEGRQELASQISRSLARSEHRTLLVDGNLQQPALHCELGFPCEPGVTDVVTGSLESAEVLHETSVPNLWFMAAGSWSQRARAALANGNFGPLVEELSCLFDFVVIDTGAILAGIDTRYLCQHADSVVLSVMRDVSRAPDLHVARSALESLGVGNLSAVVWGATEAEQYDVSVRKGRETSEWTV